MISFLTKRRWRKADYAAVNEQVDMLKALERGLRSRAKLTVQAMPYGCEIIDVESGDVLRTIKLVERQP